MGGFSNLSAGQRYFWPNGGSSAPGTTAIGSVSLTAPITMDGSDLIVWIGNGYGAAGTSGTWSGTITLHGVDAVPAPGAIALLGLAGLAGRRRR
jgi:MYXO-CTERM domain-containing protein